MIWLSNRKDKLSGTQVETSTIRADLGNKDQKLVSAILRLACLLKI